MANERAFVQRRWPRRSFGISRSAVLAWLVGAALLIAASFFLLDAAMDRSWRDWPSWLRAVAKWVSDLGYSGPYFALSGIAALWVAASVWQRAPREALLARYNQLGLALFALLSLVLSSAAATMLKYAIGRGRPLYSDTYGLLAFRPWTGGWTFTSFPSGHAATFGTVCAIAALLAPRWRWPIVGLAVCLGSVRVIEGVHFPSDAVAGLLLGAGSALAVATCFRRVGLIFNPSRSGLPVPNVPFSFRAALPDHAALQNRKGVPSSAT